jgi:hypothetical protein
MKNDFDNLTLRYLSIYNEGYSSEYGEDKRHYTADQQRALDKVMSLIKITGGPHERGDKRHYTADQQRALDKAMSLIKITGGSHEQGDAKSMLSSRHYYDNESEYGNEDNEEYGDHYRNDADSPRKNYGHSFNDGEYPDDVDYKDNGPTIEDDCEECGNEGCVDINGHCHYCNLEDEDEDRDEDNENYRPYHT